MQEYVDSLIQEVGGIQRWLIYIGDENVPSEELSVRMADARAAI